MKKKLDSYDINRSKILKYLYRHQFSSRINLAKDNNLTPATVTHLVNNLIKENKIIETGDQVRILKGSGRSRKILTLNPENAYFIGIEINATGIFSILINAIGDTIDTQKINNSNYHIADINRTIIHLIKETLSNHHDKAIKSVGIAIPGHFDNGNNQIVSNNQDWRYFNLAIIKEEIELPIVIENNIECMALSEYLFNPLNTPDHYLFMHIGPGLFCSFFDGHHIQPKANFYIGEIGHSVVDVNGPQCECGKRGCLQTYISTSWLIHYAQLLYQSGGISAINNLVATTDDIDLSSVITAYQLGDTFLVDKIDMGLKFLATSIANTLILYDAHKVYLNSELLNYLDFKEKLLEQIREQLNFIPSKTDLQIEVLPFDNHRGAKGGAALATYFYYISTTKIPSKKTI